MTPEEMDEFFKKCQEEDDQYMVGPGDQVHLGHEGKFVVTNIILGKELEERFKPDHVWKLFTMVGLRCGVNWTHPIPVMSEGRVDIRKLVGTQAGANKIVSIEYKKGVGTNKRTYKITEEDGYWYGMIVKNRGSYNV